MSDINLNPTLTVDVKVPKPFSGAANDVFQLNTFLQTLQTQFELKRITSDKLKIGFLGTNLVGSAVDWYCNFRSSNSVDKMTYDEFVKSFRDYFGGKVQEYDVVGKLTSIKQTGNIEDYIQEFDSYRLLARPGLIPDDLMVLLFSQGLNSNLRHDLRIKGVKTYQDAVQVASELGHIQQPAGSGLDVLKDDNPKQNGESLDTRILSISTQYQQPNKKWEPWRKNNRSRRGKSYRKQGRYNRNRSKFYHRQGKPSHGDDNRFNEGNNRSYRYENYPKSNSVQESGDMPPRPREYE